MAAAQFQSLATWYYGPTPNRCRKESSHISSAGTLRALPSLQLESLRCDVWPAEDELGKAAQTGSTLRAAPLAEIGLLLALMAPPQRPPPPGNPGWAKNGGLFVAMRAANFTRELKRLKGRSAYHCTGKLRC